MVFEKKVHVEIEIVPSYKEVNAREVVRDVHDIVKSSLTQFCSEAKISHDHLKAIKNVKFNLDEFGNGAVVRMWEAILTYSVFVLNEEETFEETLFDTEDDDTSAFTQTFLPSESLLGTWDSLFFEKTIKLRLITHIKTALLFSQANIDKNLISWNNMVLLHGEPGTGKTSLCKSLAQKLSILLTARKFEIHGSEIIETPHLFANSCLLEINSHSLFSKWFSESGKMVTKLFEYIRELCEDQSMLVCVLIDEVESLAGSRTSASSDPGDAVRVVNALLTQLDKLKHMRNVLILTTSNITNAIDDAFIDRADICEYIGLPDIRIRAMILKQAMNELRRVGLLDATPQSPEEDDLLHVAVGLAEGFSGRALKKLPIQAFALLQQNQIPSAHMFLQALMRILKSRDNKCK